MDRIRRLRAEGIATDEAFDDASEARSAALAQCKRFAAVVAGLTARVAKARMYAPIAGTVIHRYENVGTTVGVADRLLTIADLTRTRIVAEIDEFDAGRVSVGTPVAVRADSHRAVSWQGVIEEIPAVVVDRRMRPQDPGRPSDARVLLVKIALHEPTPLKLNQRVEVTVPVAYGAEASRLAGVGR
jgi:multidrug resistance efflux pump